MFIEEEVNQDSSVYDAFYNKYFEGWTEEFQKYKEDMKRISKIIDNKEKETDGYYPLKKDLFKSLELTPLNDVKVVVWGEEPYRTQKSNGIPRDQGYAFGVSRCDAVPKGIQNIYTELATEVEFWRPNHGDLTGWAKQGILFMNTSLCYSPKDPKAFTNLWLRFTNLVIGIINEKVPNCIHLVWGKGCESIQDNISSREVYTTTSPLVAYRGFFGCNHFIKINITLERQGKKPIDWGDL